jgi:hypothetical protein
MECPQQKLTLCRSLDSGVMQDPPIQLGRERPFYPLLLLYAATLAGWRELVVRGYPGAHRSTRMVDYEGGEGVATAEEVAAFLDRHVAGKTSLPCASENPPVLNDPDVLAREMNEFNAVVPGRAMMSAESILIVAHEISKASGRRTNAPEWEFLRHCRNAAAHNGRFTFRGGEPSRPASWGSLSITSVLEGTPLFRQADGRGLMQAGDPVRLLWDLDERYPGVRSA